MLGYTDKAICFANQWTGFYMIRTSVMKELKDLNILTAQVSMSLRVVIHVGYYKITKL